MKCLDEWTGRCAGTVELRESLSGTGTMISRCDLHYEERLRKEEEHRQVYPDSSSPPAWFDPAAAGERWDDDY